MLNMSIFLLTVHYQDIHTLNYPHELRNSRNGLINIKNNDNKCFLWCHIRHLNPLTINPERITKVDRRMVNDLNYVDIKFPVFKKDYCKIEKKNSICINAFWYENNLVYSVYLSNEKFEDCIDSLLITDENKSHYVYIKDFRRFICNKTKKNKNKKHFWRYCLHFSSEKVWQEHKKVCLKIKGKQSVKLRTGSIKLKNYFKQLAAPFKIYADFEYS